jgi:hypothetical protein
MRVAVTALLLAACSGGPPPLVSQPAQVGDLRFEAPDDWLHSEAREGSRNVARWTPKGNPDKVVISVFRTELRADHGQAGPAEIEHMLAEAQRALPHGDIGASHEYHTARGLAGFQVESDFVPAGLHARYHRVHTVLVDGPALIHVLYTARSRDAEQPAYRLVLDSIHREEG